MEILKNNMDKVKHFFVCLFFSLLVSLIIANTGCTYLSAYVGGVLGAFGIGLGKEYADCAYQGLDFSKAFNADLFFDILGGLFGAAIGSFIVYLV